MIVFVCLTFTTTTIIKGANVTNSKKITTQDKLLETKYIDDSLKSQVDKNIEKARLFQSKIGFAKYIRENQTLTSSVISNDTVVLKWNQNLNDISKSKKQLNDFVVKSSTAMTFKHIKLGDDYEIFSSIIPFTLKITKNTNKYEDYLKVIQNGKVGINNLTVMGDTITSKYSLTPINKEIVVGTKKYIKLKDPDDYDPDKVEQELKNLKLQVKINEDNKPSDYKEIASGANYIKQVKEFKASNLNKLKVNDLVEVHIIWVKENDVKIKKLELEKLKSKANDQLAKTKGLTQDNVNSYKAIISGTNSSDKINQVLKELSKLQKDYDEEQAQKVTQSIYGGASSNTSAINMKTPEVTNGFFGMPLSDMSITQDLHDGLAIDYQPKGCYLHPGCVPSFAIAGGVAHVSSGGAYGNVVVIEHTNGTCSRYAHLNSFSVTEGESVDKGDIVGMVGTTGNSTGVHLHFEIRSGGGSCFGTMINPHTYGM